MEMRVRVGPLACFRGRHFGDRVGHSLGRRGSFIRLRLFRGFPGAPEWFKLHWVRVIGVFRGFGGREN